MRNGGQSEQGEVGRGTVRVPEFLIANLELEFHVSPIRITKLRFFNRKFFAIFSSKRVTDGASRAAFSSSSKPQASSFQETLAAVAANLRYRRLEIALTHEGSTMCNFLIGGKRGQEVPIRTPAIAVRYHSAGRHSPLACPEEATAGEGSLASSSSCIAPLPRLTWRPSTSYAQEFC
jgi:hypothetical protein